MHQNKTINSSKIIILFLSIVLCMINGITTSCNLQIMSFWVFWISVLIVMHGDFLHPYVWYLGAHTLYSTAYPILYTLNLRTNRSFSPEPLFMSAIAVLTFVLIVPTYHNRGEIIQKPVGKSGLNKTLLHVMTVVIFLSAVAIRMIGFSGKRDIYSNSEFFTAVLSLVLIYIYVYIIDTCVSLCNGEKLNRLLLVEILIATLSITLITGERDLTLRLLLILIMVLFYFQRIKRRTLIILIVGFVFIIPLSWQFKYYFSTGVITQRSTDNGIIGIIYNFLSGEFESASRNLQLLVNNAEVTKGIMQGKTFISDITRIFGFGPNSSVHWYQSTFFPTSGSGQGFTLIGEGYINFGILGVVIVYCIVGCMIKVLYKNYRKDVYRMYMYFCSIPIFIYANRADLANIFSPLVRHVILSAVLYYFLKQRIKIGENNKVINE